MTDRICGNCGHYVKDCDKAGFCPLLYFKEVGYTSNCGDFTAREKEPDKAEKYPEAPFDLRPGINPDIATMLDGYEGKAIYAGECAVAWVNTVNCSTSLVDIPTAIRLAHMFSAAGEMYAALMDFLDWANEYEPAVKEVKGVEKFSAIKKDAIRATKKARGEMQDGGEA